MLQPTLKTGASKSIDGITNRLGASGVNSVSACGVSSGVLTGAGSVGSGVGSAGGAVGLALSVAEVSGAGVTSDWSGVSGRTNGGGSALLDAGSLEELAPGCTPPPFCGSDSLDSTIDARSAVSSPKPCGATSSPSQPRTLGYAVTPAATTSATPSNVTILANPFEEDVFRSDMAEIIPFFFEPANAAGVIYPNSPITKFNVRQYRL